MTTTNEQDTTVATVTGHESRSGSGSGSGAERERVFDIYRRWGYLQAALDPLGQYLTPEPLPTPAPEGPAAAAARAVYCGSIGVEFMHIENSARGSGCSSRWRSRRSGRIRHAS